MGLVADLLAVSRAPIICLAAYGRDEVIAEVLEQGAPDYIVKPYSRPPLKTRGADPAPGP